MGLVILALEKLIDGFYVNIVAAYLLYSVVVPVCGGKSLGKYVLSLNIQSEKMGMWSFVSLMIREVLLLVLLPLIFLNFLSISPLPLHDRITGTRVVRDEI